MQLSFILDTLFLVLTSIFTVYAARHLMFCFAVLLETGRSQKSDVKRLRGARDFVVPCHNEENVIDRLLQRFLEFQIRYPGSRIHIIDDASTDRTAEILETAKQKYGFSDFHVYRREENLHGKPAALNSVLPRLNGDLVLFYDADYMPEWNSLRMFRSFKTPKHAAVQGYILPFHGNWLQNTVILERLASYRVNLHARHVLGLTLQIGGTNCAIKRRVLNKLGGFDPCMLAEDTELTFRMYLAGYKIQYEPHVLSYEEAVDSLRRYWRQRYRWSYGHQQCAFKYSFSVLRSPFLRLREKIDGFLVLQLYFLPVLIAFSWLLSAAAFLLGQSIFLPLWLSIAYITVGNMAPISEIIVGLYMEKKLRWDIKYLPCILGLYVLNVFICTKSFLDLLLRRKPQWHATGHNGSP